MRADNQVGLCSTDLISGTFALFFLLTAGNQNNADLKGIQQTVDVYIMLFCQYFRWRHKRNLVAVVNGDQCRHHSHQRFTCSHISL